MTRPFIFNSIPIDVVASSSPSFTIGVKRFYFIFFTVLVISLTTCHSWTLPTTATIIHANPYGGRLHNIVIGQHTCVAIRERGRRRSNSTKHHSHINDVSNPIRQITTRTTHNNDDNRRNFLRSLTAPLLTTLTTTTPTAPATALQKRNEALCGTGFFEHYDEFRCTSIGDISDEGSSKALNGKEADISDGLMSKLGIVMDEDDGKGGKKKVDERGSVVGGGGREGRVEGGDVKEKS